MTSKKIFRVWDKDLCVYAAGADVKFARMELKADEDEPTELSFDTLCPGRYTWEQYTGLNDANGRKIFEGDILYLPPDDVAPPLYQAVVFKDGAFCMKTSAEGVYSTLNPQVLQYWEVVGNIHKKLGKGGL